MYDISRRARQRFDARARDCGLTRAQWRVLIGISRLDGPSQSEVAEILDVERITLCRLVDKLVEADLVERHDHPSDRRIRRLYITAKATPLIEQLDIIGNRMEEGLLSPLNRNQREVLVNLLTIIDNNLRAEDEVAPDMAAGQ